MFFPRQKYTLRPRGLSLALGHETRLMGIINVTDDSFSRDGCLAQRGDFVHRAVNRGRIMARQGADILDIGGESSRPGAIRISAQEEIKRVIPVISSLGKLPHVLISVDTYKPLVAKHALDAGAVIINNIEGAKPNKSLLRVVKRYDAAVVLMHMRGTPRTMQKRIHYTDVVREITAELRNSIEICLEIGIKSDKIIIDPGIGFGKTVADNLEIINRLTEFSKLNCPLLIGTSRKSFIGKILDKEVTARGWGTAASVCASILNGAHIVRVHDVLAMKDVARVTDDIVNQN